MVGDCAAAPREFLLVAASPGTTPPDLRDRLAVEPAQAPALLAQLQAAGVAALAIAAGDDGLSVWAVDADPAAAALRVVAVLADRAGVAAADLQGRLVVASGADAVRAAFHAAAALDDPHRGRGAAERFALASGAGAAASPALDALFGAAAACARRVRGAAPLAASAVGAAVDVAGELHGQLAGCSALVVGAADIGLSIANALRVAGLKRLSVSHPRPARADGLAERLGCHTLAFGELADALAPTDIVIGCLGGRAPVLSQAMVERALKRRRRRPILLIDVAAPGDFDPAIESLDGAFLYTLDDLERVARRSGPGRDAARAAAAAEVENAVDAFLAAFVSEPFGEEDAGAALAPLRRAIAEARAFALANDADDAAAATGRMADRLIERALRGLATPRPAPAPPTAGLRAALETLFDVAPEDEAKRTE